MGEKVTACTVDIEAQDSRSNASSTRNKSSTKTANVCNCRKLKVSPNQGAADSMRNVEDEEAEASLADKTEVRL